MDLIERRYVDDPIFNALVNMIKTTIQQFGYTQSDIRDACDLAIVLAVKNKDDLLDPAKLGGE